MIKVLATAILCAITSSQALADIKIYNQALQPGGYVKGNLPGCKTFTINETSSRCEKNGDFVFGFGRDAQLKQQAVFTLTNHSNYIHDMHLLSRDYNVQKIEGVPKKMVTPPKSVTSRIKNDNQQIWQARQSDSELIGYKQDFIWPAQGRISGVYGSQRVFNGVPKRPHFGLDVAAPVGTPVIAPADGVVRLAHNDMYYSGGTLIIDHGFGLSSTFIHLSKIEVELGATVKQGQLIAKIGKTGRVTGPHLDWRINWFNERLDPAFWVKTGGNQN